eukprot:4098705-Amphidinium_carterae.1
MGLICRRLMLLFVSISLKVSVAPAVVPKLRKLGFSILLESEVVSCLGLKLVGAGDGAGYSDQEYLKK